MRSQLQTICTDKNWKFAFGRADYLHMDEDDPNNPMNMVADELWLTLDPVEVTEETNDEGITEKEIYRGQMMLLFKSEIGESYPDKTTNHIDPAKLAAKELKLAIVDQCLSIVSWRVIDGLNMLFENADGVAITYQVENHHPND